MDFSLLAGRYRGTIGTCEQHTTKAGSPILKIRMMVQHWFDDTVSGWREVNDCPPIEGTYYLADYDGNPNEQALRAFIAATGWTTDPEQFNDFTWKPQVQISIALKPKKKNDGYWVTITDFVPFDSKTGSSRKATPEFLDFMARFRQTAGIPEPPPIANAPSEPIINADGSTTLADQSVVPF